MTSAFETLPRESEPITDTDRIRRVTEGLANIEALRNIFLINERASFEWIVSYGSLMEAHVKQDSGHIQWLLDIADHSERYLLDDGLTVENRVLAARLSEQKYGYVSEKDRRLLRDAVLLRCEAFRRSSAAFRATPTISDASSASTC